MAQCGGSNNSIANATNVTAVLRQAIGIIKPSYVLFNNDNFQFRWIMQWNIIKILNNLVFFLFVREIIVF